MEVTGHLRHIGLPQRIHAVEKRVTADSAESATVLLVEGPGRYADAVAQGAFDLRQRNLGY